MEPVLESLSWSEEASSTDKAYTVCQKELEKRIALLQEENRKLLLEVGDSIRKDQDALDEIYRKGRVYQLLGYISGHFSLTTEYHDLLRMDSK